MAELNLHITVTKDGKTVTRIGKVKDSKIVTFFNEGKDDLTLTFDNDALEPVSGRRLKRISGEKARKLTGKAGTTYACTIRKNKSQPFRVRSSTPIGTEVKYSAQIGGATREDPILIIEK
jgi:hypothetical protein